jgi:hypothetical protein
MTHHLLSNANLIIDDLIAYCWSLAAENFACLAPASAVLKWLIRVAFGIVSVSSAWTSTRLGTFLDHPFTAFTAFDLRQ